MTDFQPAASAERCYHCGLPVNTGSRFSTVIGGERRSMCCAGCQAVAEAIAAGGFEAYYRNRSAYASSAEGGGQADDLAVYDLPEVQAGFTREVPGAREADLLLEGITCAACIWLNEQHLTRIPGVLSVEINYTTHRARVRWDPQRVRLSQILRAVQTIGYRAFPSTSLAAEEARKRENRSALWRLFVAGFAMMQVMMYAWPAYVAEEGTMSADIARLMRIASLVLTVPVILYSCAPFFRGALRDLRLRRLGMDVPVALGILVSFAASTTATVTGRGEVYFDSIAMFVFFLLGGRYLEMRARQKAAASLDYLDRSLPLSALRLPGFPANREAEEVPAVSLRAGDLVLLKPGATIPADGVVVEGETETDESLLSGESRPALKRLGASVVAGTVNRLNPAVMRVERAGEDTRASHIKRLTGRAASQRPRLVEITDRIAGWFVGGVLVTAVLAAALWWNADPARAIAIAVAVLVVTCPCALSLATPTALTVAVGALARRGVVATRGHAIETLCRVTHIMFDKTGTLTEGRLALAEVTPLGSARRDEVLALAAALEQGSEHPLGQAVLGAAREAHVTVPLASEVRNLAGAGIEAMVAGVRLRIGTESFVAALSGPRTAHLPTHAHDAATPVWLGSERGWLAHLRFTDSLRDEAAALIAELKSRGMQVQILSGDDPAVVRRVAEQVGVKHYAGGLSPEAKQARVQALQASGAVVAMVGDGVNDAPVLAQAQLSVAMGTGAVLSQAQSDLVLLSGDLVGLREALRLSRRTMRIVGQNLLWAVGYNVVALPLAVAGYVTPWLAGIGMAASSLLVVLNALRLIEPAAAPASVSALPRDAGATKLEARGA